MTQKLSEAELLEIARKYSFRSVSEFLELAAEMGISPEVEEYTLEDANRALVELKRGSIRGAKVLRIAKSE